MRRHLFLIGMMGSGKTTMGRELARLLGAAFVDLDERIVEREGKSIPDIFAQKGDAGFRICETEALREVCARTPRVVATGGGIVTRSENISHMKACGVVVLLDRPLEEMIRDVDAEGRPNLSGGKESRMRALYTERNALYRAACDLAFDNSGTPQAAARRLLEQPLLRKI